MIAEYKKLKDKVEPWRIILRPENKFENRALKAMIIRNPLGIGWCTPQGVVKILAEPERDSKFE